MSTISRLARDLLRQALGPQVLALEATADAIEAMIDERLGTFVLQPPPAAGATIINDQGLPLVNELEVPIVRG